MEYATQWHCTGSDDAGLLDYTCDVTATTTAQIATSTEATTSTQQCGLSTSTPCIVQLPFTFADISFSLSVIVFFLSFGAIGLVFSVFKKRK